MTRTTVKPFLKVDSNDAESGFSDRKIAKQIQLHGRVQGLGVRPAIAQLACRLLLNGFVKNTSDGVLVHVEGIDSAVTAFTNQLPAIMPSLSKFVVAEIADQPIAGYPVFQIETGLHAGPLAAEVPLDLAMCEECAQELADAGDRRCGYAFSTCTQCGPRYSIIKSMPYERHVTAMSPFAPCADCEREFLSQRDRRFHAQTVACKKCGPVLWFEPRALDKKTYGTNAIAEAARIVSSGGILALKGLGGYQLICDASSKSAVLKLRECKQRRTKPLAVMVALDETWLRQLSSGVLSTLTSPENPIVIVDGISHPLIVPQVNSGMNSLGVFLPTTPLHALLMNALQRPLVVTSGNLGAEPIVYDEVTARHVLSDPADGWLQHDRSIERPVDDSVVRWIAERSVTIRASRGIAPLRLPVESQHLILAVGGEQKVACAIANGRQVILGPHIGDMSSLSGRQRFVDQTNALQKLCGTTPEVIAHDMHPDYFTTRWAAEQGVRTMAIQHHHAHIVSGMLEHELMEQRVLGVAFDGTGYGVDGTIWGAEFLLASKTGFQRVASLLPFVLPGGDTVIREPWRTAVSLLTTAIPDITPERVASLLRNSDITDGCTPNLIKIRQVQTLVTSGIGPVSSSMGRLFDGMASMVLGISTSDFEGEPAMRLEAICREGRSSSCDETARSRISLLYHDIIRIDWRPLVRRVVAEIQSGAAASLMAAEFHRFVAEAVGTVAMQFPDYPVVMSGGCFQNQLLTELSIEELRDQSRFVAAPGRIPPNDGGLAAGQIAIAAALLDEENQRRNT